MIQLSPLNDEPTANRQSTAGIGVAQTLSALSETVSYLGTRGLRVAGGLGEL